MLFACDKNNKTAGQTGHGIVQVGLSYSGLKPLLQAAAGKRQPQPGANKKAAADAIVQPAEALQPTARRSGKHRPKPVTNNYHCHKDAGEEQQLAAGIGCIADKLR